MAQGWSGSTRLERLPEDWSSRRAYVFERDGFRCRALLPDGRRCINDATDVDHIIPNDDDGYSNLQSLCDPHHRAKSSAEGGRASAAARRRGSATPGAAPQKATGLQASPTVRRSHFSS